MADRWGKRRRWIYAYDVRVPGTQEVMKVAYIGRTSSPLHFRDTQHRQLQPWAWAIVGDIYVLEVGYWGRLHHIYKEWRWIWRELPVFNDRVNRWIPCHPRRITLPEAVSMYDRRRAWR